MASIIAACCCNPLSPVECIPDTVAIRKLRSRGGPTPASYGIVYDSDGPFIPAGRGGTGPLGDGSEIPEFATRNKCYRLYVWETVTVGGNSYGSRAPDFILKTNDRAFRGHGAPTPFNTTAGSGIPLDDPPYWWADCQWGGYADVGSMWFNITSDMIDARRTAVLGDGTYTMLALVEFSHWKYLTGDGGGIIVGVTDGAVVLKGVKHVLYG